MTTRIRRQQLCSITKHISANPKPVLDIHSPALAQPPSLGYPHPCSCAATQSGISTHLLLRRCLVLDIHLTALVPPPSLGYPLTCSCAAASLGYLLTCSCAAAYLLTYSRAAA
ncbi:hypothetical protein PoB_005553600 [Plakobranchus ocellatus]|uniref:Uncharacterized protein n=1 Tax=Plakobranchus ocellatus TaxID=259542 RepID=A0AAV4C8I5_9GAST|nr:hypothetical protein PoB_005553600 [Plakobranchus ocellatus]